MDTFNSFRKFNSALSFCLQVLLVLVFLVLVVDVIWGVASRYLLGTQASWSEELARLLMVWLALLGAALVSREDRHLGLDVIVSGWPEEVQRLGRMFVHLAIIAFASVIMAWGGFQLVGLRFASGQEMPALGIGKAWFYLAIPVSGCLITLFSVESFWADWVRDPAEGKEAAE